MPIKKHITAIVIVIALHQSIAVRAEESEPYPRSIPPEQQKAEQSFEQPSEGVIRPAEPLVDTIQSLPSNTSSEPDKSSAAKSEPFPPSIPPEQQKAEQSFEQPSEGVIRPAEPLVDTIQSSPSNTSSEPDKSSRETNYIDLLHEELSQRLLTSAVWLDSFFADERYSMESNRSYVRLRYDIFKEKASSIFYRPSVDMRLALPKLEKKARIVVSAEPAELRATAPSPASTAGERAGTTEDRNVTTAFYYILRDTLKENFIIRTGAQFSNGKPVLFISPRYRYFVPIDSWDSRFTQEETWNTDTGWRVNTILDLERQLPYDLFFRTSAGGTWIETSEGYYYTLNFTVRQPLDQKHALTYSWSNSFQTRPVNELMEVLFSVQYRQSFWREWVFFEVAPQCRFPRDREFNGAPGILFRFEMFIGNGA